MSATSRISIAAFVTEGERGPVQTAARHLARVLSEAGGTPWTCECTFARDLDALKAGEDANIIVSSLLPEVAGFDEEWAETERRLLAGYAAVAEREVPVFLSTIVRHIGADAEPDLASALRIRIRRLNLLAAEISRATGTYVIDLDRVVANIGARRLGTDYRLAGTAAAAIASHSMALAFLTNGTDALVSYEMQEAARNVLEVNRPEIAGVDTARPAITLKRDLVALGSGRRKQIVSPVAFPVDENYAAWLVRQVLRGSIGPGEALSRLYQAVRRRGIRGSAVLLASGLSRQINRRK
jgi:hypothetical protein